MTVDIWGGVEVVSADTALPAATAAAFRDGTFRTSDLGRWVDGRLDVLGRADDVIVTGGEPGDFLSAGGHLAGPDGEAGHPEHAGDLPPLFVTEDGTARIMTLTDRLDRDLLLDDDGSAVMIHENSDNLANIPERYAPDGPDEETRNAGDGGSRVACGVVSEQN